MKFFISIILIFSFYLGFGQIVGKTVEGYVVEMILYEGDTIPRIELDAVLIMPKKVYNNERDKRKFLRLVRKIKKVLPYAKLANNTLYQVQLKLDSIEDKSQQKKYIKLVDKALKERYGEELKRLTISEGRILIKLIDRETGDTSYELIEELRGSFSAFMWQSLARLFGENLKQDYDAEGEDKLIEEIILRIEAGQY
jgi:hypothetical protein